MHAPSTTTPPAYNMTHQTIALSTDRDRESPLSPDNASDVVNPKVEDGSDFNPDLRFYLAWTSICIVVLMAALDATSLSVALPQISHVLKGDAIEAFWAGTSFLLTSTVFQPVIASLSMIFGRVRLLFTSLTLFGVGAIIAALAKSGNGMATMLIGRSIQVSRSLKDCQHY